MAEYALPPGAVRRRAVFGLLDADGWMWASLKAAFWFLLIIFLQGYLPDRAYYFTVSPTIDLGFNVISPVNLCPGENDRGDRKLPCPPPAGAVVPWEQGPTELTLPTGRAGAGIFTSGEDVYVIGGRTPDGATASVITSTTFDGNLTAWKEASALPQPRSDAAVVSLSGVPYVIGGRDTAGAPTTTVFRGVVENGELTGWEDATDIPLPVALSDLAATSTATGLWVFGGRTADGALSATTYHSELPTTGTPTLGEWREVTELALPEARADAAAASTGSAVYVIGGQGPSGPTNSVFYLAFDTHGDPNPDPATQRPFGWGVSVGRSAAAALPEPRYDQISFVNSGTLFTVGGFDANGNVVATNLWTVPSSTDGTIRGWNELAATALPGPRAQGAAAVVGQFAYVAGGTTDGSNLDNGVLRSDVAPRPPFFRLGLFGVTVPAMSIKGEIGQQLGYIAAASVVGATFILLVVIGWMYSHKPETYRFFRWISRGRFRPPREDEYQV
jgi:hypothetical protein